MCQSEELKCDSKFLKVHLLCIQRLCEVEDVWASRATASIGSPAVHWWVQIGALGMQRSPSDSCFSSTALFGFWKCTAQCVCNFLCPALYAGHLYIHCTACVCTCATAQCCVQAGEVMASGFWVFYAIEPESSTQGVLQKLWMHWESTNLGEIYVYW